jgi:hypothetical protein
MSALLQALGFPLQAAITTKPAPSLLGSLPLTFITKGVFMGITAAVMKNTALTFGVALTSGAVTLACSKLQHYSFEVTQDIKINSSAVIRLLSFISGAAVGYYVMQKVSIVNMDLDQSFVSAHAIHVLTAIYCSSIAYLVSFNPDKSSTVLHAGLAGLALSTPFVTRLGQSALIPAIGIGAAIGSYL